MGIGRAFSPLGGVAMGVSWGGAPGWNGFGPSALLSALTFLPKSQRPAVIPARRPARTFPQGPTARLHTRPARRPARTFPQGPTARLHTSPARRPARTFSQGPTARLHTCPGQRPGKTPSENTSKGQRPDAISSGESLRITSLYRLISASGLVSAGRPLLILTRRRPPLVLVR